MPPDSFDRAGRIKDFFSVLSGDYQGAFFVFTSDSFLGRFPFTSRGDFSSNLCCWLFIASFPVFLKHNFGVYNIAEIHFVIAESRIWVVIRRRCSTWQWDFLILGLFEGVTVVVNGGGRRRRRISWRTIWKFGLESLTASERHKFAVIASFYVAPVREGSVLIQDISDERVDQYSGTILKYFRRSGRTLVTGTQIARVCRLRLWGHWSVMRLWPGNFAAEVILVSHWANFALIWGWTLTAAGQFGIYLLIERFALRVSIRIQLKIFCSLVRIWRNEVKWLTPNDNVGVVVDWRGWVGGKLHQISWSSLIHSADSVHIHGLHTIFTSQEDILSLWHQSLSSPLLFWVWDVVIGGSW